MVCLVKLNSVANLAISSYSRDYATMMNTAFLTKFSLYIFISIFYILTLQTFFKPSVAHGASLFRKDRPTTPKTTIKTLPKESVQTLIVPKDSSFFKLYMEAINDDDINSEAINPAFEFLLKHKDNLIKGDLCLSKDNIANTQKIRNQNCLIVADYTKSKLEKRLHIFKFDEGKIYSLYTAHGKGSNEKEDSLIATKFSNTPSSLQTSLGFFLTDESYNSSKDTFGPGPNNGVKLDGLSCSTNNARRRYIVVHTAKYVTDTLKDKDSIGYSEGCITLSPEQKTLMLSCTKGALLYTHGTSSN